MEIYTSKELIQILNSHSNSIKQLAACLDTLSYRISHLESRLKALENPKKED